MKTLVGILLVIFGMAACLIANLLHFRAQADLLEKHPEWSSMIPDWWSAKRHAEFSRLYKSAFPDGGKMKQFWSWALAAFLSWFLGWFLLEIHK